MKKKHRARVIEFFIDVARECFNIGNFNSLMAIICELLLLFFLVFISDYLCTRPCFGGIAVSTISHICSKMILRQHSSGRFDFLAEYFQRQGNPLGRVHGLLYFQLVQFASCD